MPTCNNDSTVSETDRERERENETGVPRNSSNNLRREWGMCVQRALCIRHVVALKYLLYFHIAISIGWLNQSSRLPAEIVYLEILHSVANNLRFYCANREREREGEVERWQQSGCCAVAGLSHGSVKLNVHVCASICVCMCACVFVKRKIHLLALSAERTI